MMTEIIAHSGLAEPCQPRTSQVRLLFNALLESGCNHAEALGAIWPLVLVDGRPDHSPSLARIFALTVAPDLGMQLEEIEQALAQPVASKMATVSCLLSLQAIYGVAL